MKNFWHLSAAGVALTFVGTLAGCGGNTPATDNTTAAPSDNTAAAPADNTASSAPPAAGGATALTGAGATFPAPLYSRWFEDYNKSAGVQINYQSVGSGAGIKQLTSKTVDFGASDAPLNAKETAALPSPVATIPTVGGAVVVAYNLPGAPQNLKFTGEALAGIFLGNIKKWNDPAIASINPGVTLPPLAITVAHRSDGSGTTNIFTNYLASASSDWKTKVGAGKSVDWPTGIGGKGNDGVASNLGQASGAIGYVELAYAKQKKLPYASIKNAAGQFVAPDVAGVTAAAEGSVAAVTKDITAPIANAAGAKAYPISGFTYIMVYKTAPDAAKGAALKAFLKWAMADGQSSAASLDYAPLPKAVVALNEKTIDALK